MKRGMLVRVCALAVLFGLLVSSVFTQSVAGASTGYEVGYAKVDVNPWVDLKLPDGTTIGISASDPSISASDAAKYIVETEIADPANTSKTMKQKIVAVPLGGYGNAPDRLASGMMDDNGDGKVGYGDGVFSTCTTVTDAYGKTVVYVTIDCIRASDGMTATIRKNIVAAIGADKISAEQIMVSASHSHSAPDYAYSSQNTAWKAYYNYVIAKIASAAKDAYDNRSAAEMTKGSIEASDAMNTLGYGDIPLNYVRHRAGTYTVKQEKRSIFGSSWTTLATDRMVRTPHTGKDFTKTINGTKYRASFVLDNEVSEVDETLHVLQFTRTKGEPVLLVNWRAHATMNGSSTNPVISADYVGSLRYNLEKAGFCVGFWQGASGNVNPGRVEETNEPWSVLNVNGLGTDESTKAARYGYLLARVALTCVNSNHMQACEEGRISNRQALINLEREIDSDGLVEASKSLKAEIEAGGKLEYFYTYKHTDGKYYVINSDLHYEQILARSKRTENIQVELNVMTLGKDVALVTVPFEPFDRYSNDATMSNTTDNDWDDLIGDVYGTPFVLGYSNGHEGYLPNALSYTYKPSNSKLLQFYGEGSYESNTAKVAKGAGETLVAELGNMFEVLATGYKTDLCEACNKEVQWTPLTANQIGRDLESGHYYLAENIKTQTRVESNDIGSNTTVEKVCLDLNGKTLDHRGQVFEVYNGSTLSIMDSGVDGKIIARSGGDLTGGLAWVYSGGTLNLYDGTLQFIKDAKFTGNHTARGGVIYNSGTLNVYDGTIVGGEIVVSDWVDSSTGDGLSPNGVGGAVAVVGGNATLNMFGGLIKSGPSARGVTGSCVYVTMDSNGANGYHAINLTGDASIEEIYVKGHYTKPRSISISGKYTGGFAVNLDPSISLSDVVYLVRLSADADVSKANIYCVNDATYSYRIGDGSSSVSGVKLEKGRLYAVRTFVASIDDTKYTNIGTAFNEYAGGIMTLLCDVQTVVLNKNVELLDLNGHTIQKLVVNKGYTVTCMDSQTDDFTVENGPGYGKIEIVSGDVRTIPVEEDGYVMLGDDINGDGVPDYDVSFHRVDLGLSAVSLRAKSDANGYNPGIYYTSNFAADEVVKKKVKTFGVALSLVDVPNASNMSDYSRFDGANFQAGEDKNTANSTLLVNVMQQSADAQTNGDNASKTIYGRAYIQLTDGSYIFGNAHTGTLKGLLEEVNNRWSEYTDTQRNEVVQLYKTYTQVMSGWNIDDIKAAAN